MIFLFLLLAFGIIASLAWYAGSLLYKLQLQKLKVKTTNLQRIDKIGESIRVIAIAMEQQQCNLSEGCIRLHHLLESIPIGNKIDIWHEYAGIHALYQEVNNLATHQARAQFSRAEIKRQDVVRENKEAQLDVKILADVTILKNFHPNLLRK